MKPGFSIIEIVVAIAIGAIVAMLLYQATAQTARVVKTIEVQVDVHTELALFMDRIQKDISGAFVPHFPEEKEEAELQQKKEEKKQNKDSKPEKKKENEQNIFDVQSMDITDGMHKGASLFTFVSTNPLMVYGESVPRRVRISYSFEDQKEGKALFKLLRYESPEVDFKKFEEKKKSRAIKGYTILRNIRSFSMECFAPAEEEKKGDGSG